MYFRLPLASSSPSSRPTSSHSGNSRYPLSSPTTTPATVCTQKSLATRRDSNSSVSDARSARALLSRVASSPIVPPSTSCKSHPSSPLSTASSHSRQHSGEHEQPSSQRQGVVGAMERRWSDGYEVARGWDGHQQSCGYVSFPDYEKYFPEDDVGERPAEAYARHHAAAQDARGREIQT